MFESKAIKAETCGTNGLLLIEGTLNKKIKNELKFHLPILYPNITSLICEITGKEAGETKISCQINRSLDKTKVIFENTIIKDGSKEVLVLRSFSSNEGITCSNGLLIEAEKRTKIDVSFRQVSHFKLNGNGFSFFLAAFVTKRITIGFTINIKIIISKRC